MVTSGNFIRLKSSDGKGHKRIRGTKPKQFGWLLELWRRVKAKNRARFRGIGNSNYQVIDILSYRVIMSINFLMD